MKQLDFALKPGGDSAVAKRQEVGRGLRIAVDMIGNRVDFRMCHQNRAEFHNINRLTVIATDTYKDFVSDLQKEIKANLADRPTKATIEYFQGKFVSDGTNQIVVDEDMASDIQSYLRFSDYINRENRLTSKYFDDKAAGTLVAMPSVLAPYSESIHKLVQGIFDDQILKEMISDDRQTGIKDNPLNDNFKKKEFQELWNQINHKYAYTVQFDSDELIEKAVENIEKNLFVSELKYVVTTGEQRRALDENQVKKGESFGGLKTRTESLSSTTANNTKYDIVGKIKEATKLTRKSVVKILQYLSPKTFEMFKVNPEEFISKVSRLIDEQKATMIVDHITYNLTDGKYDNDIFTANQIKTDLNKVYKANKAIQDYVVTDGTAEKSNERKFVEDLDQAEEVCVYAKLPRTFQIPTPVGNYAPDWAIAFNDNMGIKHIYFVAETKGSMDSLELRGIEKAKTDCAKKLFNELKLCGNVKYDVIDSFDKLMSIVK